MVKTMPVFFLDGLLKLQGGLPAPCAGTCVTAVAEPASDGEGGIRTD
jgi:hypothetical protein